MKKPIIIALLCSLLSTQAVAGCWFCDIGRDWWPTASYEIEAEDGGPERSDFVTL